MRREAETRLRADGAAARKIRQDESLFRMTPVC
jgi:hypothetical protein